MPQPRRAYTPSVTFSATGVSASPHSALACSWVGEVTAPFGATTVFMPSDGLCQLSSGAAACGPAVATGSASTPAASSAASALVVREGLGMAGLLSLPQAAVRRAPAG